MIGLNGPAVPLVPPAFFQRVTVSMPLSGMGVCGSSVVEPFTTAGTQFLGPAIAQSARNFARTTHFRKIGVELVEHLHF